MEAASLLKITKNAFYRAINIFSRVSTEDKKILQLQKV
jgi:hypothetical protein